MARSRTATRRPSRPAPAFQSFFAGALAQERIPEMDRSAHLLFSADLNPACPNSVIEALACGTPVVGFDTGALKELVPETCGRIVPYGGDPWKLETPDLPGLAAAAAEVLRDRPALQPRGASTRRTGSGTRPDDGRLFAGIAGGMKWIRKSTIFC